MKQVNIQFSEQQLAEIDAMRGDFTRSEFIRQCVKGVWERAGRQWPDDVGSWGGLREGAFGVDELELDRADVRLLGLPPLADDDV
jgi:hypothetical protein